MRLIDQGGKFTTQAGRGSVGLSFRCPHAPDCQEHIVVPFANPLDGGPPVHTCCWSRVGDTIDTLTLSPSIDHRHCVDPWADPPTDASRAFVGWHGHIINGELRSV